MVLQRAVPVQVWGYGHGDLLDDVVAGLSCVSADDGKSWNAALSPRRLADGVWSMELPARSAENRCDIEVKS